MASAIRLADRINTVSPSYALEILRPCDTKKGFSGGEGPDFTHFTGAESQQHTGKQGQQQGDGCVFVHCSLNAVMDIGYAEDKKTALTARISHQKDSFSRTCGAYELLLLPTGERKFRCRHL